MYTYLKAVVGRQSFSNQNLSTGAALLKQLSSTTWTCAISHWLRHKIVNVALHVFADYSLTMGNRNGSFEYEQAKNALLFVWQFIDQIKVFMPFRSFFAFSQMMLIRFADDQMSLNSKMEVIKVAKMFGCVPKNAWLPFESLL